MAGRFEGKVVVVTGASRGIGGSTAVAFAREGAQVFAVDINRAGLESLEAEAGPRIATLHLDVTSPGAVRLGSRPLRLPTSDLAGISGQARFRSIRSRQAAACSSESSRSIGTG